MRFKDDAIKLILKIKKEDGTVTNTLKFKSYIEKSDITYKVEQQDIKFIPIGSPVKGLNTQLIYNIDLAFDLFAEDRQEAINNYKDFHILLESLKPTYIKDGDIYESSRENSFGNISIDFAGFPKILSTGKEIPLRVTNFTYSINKDMGYIQVPFYGSREEQKLLYVNGKMSLVPISFKIGITGQVSADLLAMAKIENNNPPPPSSDTNSGDTKSGSDAGGTDTKSSTKTWSSLSSDRRREIITNLSENKIQYPADITLTDTEYAAVETKLAVISTSRRLIDVYRKNQPENWEYLIRGVEYDITKATESLNKIFEGK